MEMVAKIFEVVLSGDPLERFGCERTMPCQPRLDGQGFYHPNRFPIPAVEPGSVHDKVGAVLFGEGSACRILEKVVSRAA